MKGTGGAGHELGGQADINRGYLNPQNMVTCKQFDTPNFWMKGLST